MNKDQIKSFCSVDDPSEPETLSPKIDYVLLFKHEMVLYIDFEGEFITTLQGSDHFGEYSVFNWSDIEVFKRVKE